MSLATTRPLVLCSAPVVENAEYITIPFSASTLGPRNGAAALDLVSAAIHVTTGATTTNFQSGVAFFDPDVLVDRTANLLCPLALSDMSYGGDSDTCLDVTLDFILLDGDASHAAIEDDIRADLAKVGITAVARPLAKDDLNTAMVAGDFDLVFSETWGAPYDPHSFVSSWTTPDEAHYPVLQTLDAPLDPTTFASTVSTILAETDPVARQAGWTDLLSAIHGEVIHLPLYGKRIPAIFRRSRLTGYAPGQQQFVAASDVFSELSAKHHDRGSPRFAAVSSLSTRCAQVFAAPLQ